MKFSADEGVPTPQKYITELHHTVWEMNGHILSYVANLSKKQMHAGCICGANHQSVFLEWVSGCICGTNEFGFVKCALVAFVGLISQMSQVWFVTTSPMCCGDHQSHQSTQSYPLTLVCCCANKLFSRTLLLVFHKTLFSRALLLVFHKTLFCNNLSLVLDKTLFLAEFYCWCSTKHFLAELYRWCSTKHFFSRTLLLLCQQTL